MSAPFKWPEPAWLAALPADQQPVERLRYYISLASLFANDRMSILDFSKDIGLHEVTLSKLKGSKARRLSDDVARRIEVKLGADLFPSSLFTGE